MKNYSISKLAEEFGLSRSTLLYYDRMGLLPPTGRSGSGYRYYTEKDRCRLERVCRLREAGLTLKEIRDVIAAGGKPGAKLLQRRLRETAEEIFKLRVKQRLLTGMLNRVVAGAASIPVDKKMWIELLRSAGMDDTAMARWHCEFERRSPDGHQEFLVALGVPEHEVKKIREWSRAGVTAA